MTLPFQVQGATASPKEGMHYLSADESMSVQLRAALHLDAAYFTEDETTLDDNVLVRRARLTLLADFYRNWRLNLAYDAADKEEPVSALWLRYSTDEDWRITVGQFQEPFGLEEMISSNVSLFMEPSLLNELVPGDNIGAALARSGSAWSASAGFFWENYIEDGDGFSSRVGRGVSGRLTAAPVQREAALLHLGISASRRLPASDRRLRFSTTPESEVTDVRFVDTGSLDQVNDYAIYGVEAATIVGRFMAQGEYVVTVVDRSPHSLEENGTVSFSGHYVAASYLVRGGQRHYSPRLGAFGGVHRAAKGRSAWELTLRRSVIDLNDSVFLGGNQTNTTWGVNWYPSVNVRVMFNYIHVNANVHTGNDLPAIAQVRLQLAM